METDTSNQAISGILSQYHVINGCKWLHPVEYHAKTLSATQHNWPIHDKKLLAIMYCFRKWRDSLVDLKLSVYTAHQVSQYFNTKQKLNSRQALWYLRIFEFIYHIHSRSAFRMCKPDGVSRCSEDMKSGMDTYFFDEGQLLNLENDDVGEEEDVDDVELEGIDVATLGKKNGLWVVLQEHRLEVLRQHHDSQVAGHRGRHRTQELVSRNFIWDKWPEDIARYVAACVKYQKSKADGYSKQTK